MAILNDPLFGKLSGRLGDYVFKQVNGKTVVCYMPKKQKKNEETEESHQNLLSKFIKKNLLKRKP
jgi:hypothetical protein